MTDKGVVIYYRAGVEYFDYDTGFVKATDYEALRKRCEAVEADELVESLRSAASRWKRESDYHASGIADDYGAGQRHAFLSCATEMLAIIDQAIAASQEPSHG